jgi:hypothetical protein
MKKLLISGILVCSATANANKTIDVDVEGIRNICVNEVRVLQFLDSEYQMLTENSYKQEIMRRARTFSCEKSLEESKLYLSSLSNNAEGHVFSIELLQECGLSVESMEEFSKKKAIWVKLLLSNRKILKKFDSVQCDNQ